MKKYLIAFQLMLKVMAIKGYEKEICDCTQSRAAIKVRQKALQAKLAETTQVVNDANING